MHRFIPDSIASWTAPVTEIPSTDDRESTENPITDREKFKVLLDLLVVKFLFRFTRKNRSMSSGVSVGSMALSASWLFLPST